MIRQFTLSPISIVWYPKRVTVNLFFSSCPIFWLRKFLLIIKFPSFLSHRATSLNLLMFLPRSLLGSSVLIRLGSNWAAHWHVPRGVKDQDGRLVGRKKTETLAIATPGHPSLFGASIYRWRLRCQFAFFGLWEVKEVQRSNEMACLSSYAFCMHAYTLPLTTATHVSFDRTEEH